MADRIKPFDAYLTPAPEPPPEGTLAGLHPSRVRALRSAGEIRGWTSEGTGRGATPCPAKAARVWLAARGVSGI